MRALDVLLNQYAESHQNPVNKKVHYLCVPLIYFSFMALFYCIPFSFGIFAGLELNIATLVSVGALVYYLYLSPSLFIGMALFTFFCLGVSAGIVSFSGGKISLLIIGLLIFVISWIVQIWGHKVEGKKPSFFKDIQFLLIGPAWILSFIYQKGGIKY